MLYPILWCRGYFFCLVAPEDGCPARHWDRLSSLRFPELSKPLYLYKIQLIQITAHEDGEFVLPAPLSNPLTPAEPRIV